MLTAYYDLLVLLIINNYLFYIYFKYFNNEMGLQIIYIISLFAVDSDKKID